MAKISFAEQPLIVKAAVLVTFYNAWVLFEELVIDRYGLWRYLPLYQRGYFCIWDVAAILVIGLVVLRLAFPITAAKNICAIRRYLHRCPICA
jgi:hypothetical protein